MFLMVRLILVLGHQNCGAVKATLDGGEHEGVNHLLHSELALKGLIQNSGLKIKGAYYNLETRKVEFI